MAPLADAGLVTVGVTNLADDKVWLRAAPIAVVNNPEHSDSEMSCDDCVSAVFGVRGCLRFATIHVSCVPVCMNYDVPADGYSYTFETLSELLCAVMDGVAYREKIEALSGYFHPRDYGEWCDDDVPDVVEGYCVSRPAGCC